MTLTHQLAHLFRPTGFINMLLSNIREAVFPFWDIYTLIILPSFHTNPSLHLIQFILLCTTLCLERFVLYSTTTCLLIVMQLVKNSTTACVLYLKRYMFLPLADTHPTSSAMKMDDGVGFSCLAQGHHKRTFFLLALIFRKAQTGDI